MGYAPGEKGKPEDVGRWGGQYLEQLSNLNCCASLSLPRADNRHH